jgi:uncharacterized delta-60 repeat protein
MRLFRLLAMGCAGAAFGAAAAPGDLDPAFGENGAVWLDALGGYDALAVDDTAGGGLVVQVDGKALVPRPGGVWRLNPDGTPDLSFGTGGKALAPSGISTNSVLELADGKIATGGNVVEHTPNGIDIQKLTVTRLLSDGRTDLTFGVDGQATVDLSTNCCAGSARALALLEQRDGKIVAAGSVGYTSWWDVGGFGPDLVLLRFDTAGSLDPSFGGSGTVLLHTTDWVTPESKFASGGELLGLTEQPDGALVAAGFMETQLAVARFSADGVLDRTFGAKGVVTLHVGPPGAAAIASAVAMQGDGKIVAAGRTRFDCDLDDPSCERVRQAVVARFDADGRLDPSFGTGGILLLDAGEAYTEIAQGGLALEASGRIVVGGNTESPDGPRYTFVARLTAAGALDVDFGHGGVTLIDTGHGSSAPGARFGGLARTATGGLAVTATDPGADGKTVVARLADSGGHPGVIGLAATELTVGEGSDARFVVHRTGGAQGTVSVQYATYASSRGAWDYGPPSEDIADSADFRAESGTLTWSDGDATERTIAIPLTMDMVIEDNESFGFALSDVGGGAALAATDGTVWITDVNRNAGELQFAAAEMTVSERSFAMLPVTRTGGSTGAVDVDYGTVSGTADEEWDFASSNGTLHWANGDTSPKSIRFSINGDGEAEPNETFSVRLHDPSGGATLGSVSTVTVTIVDVPPGSSPSPPPPGPVVGVPPMQSPNASTSGGGGSLGLLDVLWLGLVTVVARVAQLNGGRAQSRGQAHAVGRS